MQHHLLEKSKTNPTAVMLQTNVAELWLLVDTFTRVWTSGGQANLSLETKDSQVWAKLDLQLGPAGGHRPGPPEAGGRQLSLGSTRHSQTVLPSFFLGNLQSSGKDRQLGLETFAAVKSVW